MLKRSEVPNNDPNTGKLTGTRKHEAIKFVKAYDASSPYLYKAVCEGQTFTEVEFKWYRIYDTGTETYQKIIWTYVDGNLQASDSWKEGR